MKLAVLSDQMASGRLLLQRGEELINTDRAHSPSSAPAALEASIKDEWVGGYAKYIIYQSSDATFLLHP